VHTTHGELKTGARRTRLRGLHSHIQANRRRESSIQSKRCQNRESDDLTSSARPLKSKIRARGISN
jgi:hypothetical protein